MVAAIGVGPLVDRYVPHRPLVLPIAAMAFACLVVGAVSWAGGTFAYAMALGGAYGRFQAINVAVYAHYFGRAHAGEIRGVTCVITIVGAASTAVRLGGRPRSYFPVLAAGAALCASAIVAKLVVDRPAAG